jgi:hypothetical protein
MNGEEKGRLEGLLLKFLEAAASRFSESDRTLGPEAMALLIVEYLTSPTFWTEDVKKEMAVVVTPFVKAWYEGRLRE